MTNFRLAFPTSRQRLGAIMIVAMLLRLAVVWWTRSYVIEPTADHFAFGYEAGRIARSLALGHGFASPLPFASGPTAYLAPTYPLLLSGIFRLFGVYTVASAWAAYTLNAAASALTCLVLFRLGSVIFGEAAGLVAAGLFALYPNSIWFAGGTIWDTALVALCLPLLMLCFYLLPFDQPPRKLALTGLWMGLVSLLNPAANIAGAVGLCWIWIRLRGAGAARYWKPGLAAGICFLVMLPWMVRNAVVMGEFTPRTGTGFLRAGNSEAAWEAGTGLYTSALYPADSAVEGKRWRELGEAAYDRAVGREAVGFIRKNPGKFLILTWKRIRNWWIGYDSNYTANFKGISSLRFWKRLFGAFWLPFFLIGAVSAAYRGYPVYPLLATILIYPSPYYVSIVSARYRFPTEPLILIFVAYCLIQVWAKVRKRVFPALRAQRDSANADVPVQRPGQTFPGFRARVG